MGIVKFKKIKNSRKTRIGQIFWNLYNKKHKKTQIPNHPKEENPSWDLTHPPTSEFF